LRREQLGGTSLCIATQPAVDPIVRVFPQQRDPKCDDDFQVGVSRFADRDP
jgi:hypothetical protein